MHGPINIQTSIPSGYREHLEILQETLGEKRVPYFGPGLEYPKEARGLWEGYRGIEEYAREVFPDEEAANGLTWMDEDGPDQIIADTDDEGSAGLPTPARTPIHTPGIRTPRNHPEFDAMDFFVGSC